MGVYRAGNGINSSYAFFNLLGNIWARETPSPLHKADK